MQLERISENIYEIPKKGEMNVPARVYASEELLEEMKEDDTLEQVRNMAALPGIQDYSIVMPDGHQGYGFPIGGVAAFDAENGIISPGGIGYDINCGVRLLRSDLPRERAEQRIEPLVEGLFHALPSGVGARRSDLVLDRD